MIELKLISDFGAELIAVDEVGRSPLCGPVVIGAVRVYCADHQSLITLLRSLRRNGAKDSKELTSEDRKELLQKLNIPNLPFRERGEFNWKGLSISFVTWEMDHEVIDRENVLKASLRGMKEAATFLQTGALSRTTLLIDGPFHLIWEEKAPWKEIPLIQGDAKSSLIGLASIIAKEKRDAYMREMHMLYPHYGLDHNVGYPTLEHRKAIEVFGPSPIHRRSFKKVKEFIKGD